MPRRAALAVVGLAALAAAWLAGMRRKSSVVVRAQRQVNRAVLNPRQMASAGRPGAYASIVRHTGRTSGRSYETPVGAVPTEDGFVVALVYGAESDWLKNVLASGTATVVHEGESVPVDRPEVLPFESAARYFSESDRRSMRLFGVRQVLHVTRAPGPSGEAA